MFVFVLLVAVIALISMRKRDEKFLSHRQTTIINGIFVLLIFFSHSNYSYLHLPGNILDLLYSKFQGFHNQWVVATFLAFSGYGVMSKIKTGGVEYIEKFPRNRLLKTLLNFDIAVLLFLISDIILGIHYDPLTIAGSFIAFTDVGNSNWYIFTILLMYLVSYIAAVVMKDNHKGIAIIVTVCSILYVVIAQITGLPSRFVSTVVTYALGMWLAIYKDEIERLFKTRSIISLILILIPVVATYELRDSDYIMNLNSCFFVMAVVWFMTHFELRSNILYFCGRHAFSIFILQRLPWIIVSHFYQPTGYMNYILVVACLAVTIGISVVFDRILLPAIDKKIIRS